MKHGSRLWTVLAVGGAIAAGGPGWAHAGTEAPAPGVTNLPPLTVVAAAIPAAWGDGQVDSAARALEATPGVLLLSQGGAGAQTDLSIRGSSFSGAGLTFGGLSLRNPQTEHFNAELPLPASLFIAPRVATGLDQAQAGDGHLVGSLVFDPAPIRQPTRRITAGGGERSRHWQTALAREPLATTPGGGQWSAGAFGANERASALDFRDNDLELWNAGGQVQYADRDTQVDLLAGHQQKKFGARGYYGVNPSLPAEEDLRDTLLLFTGRRGAADGDHIRLSGQWREIEDTYRILPDIFLNHTDSRILAVGADGRQGIGSRADLQWRAGFEDEQIDGLTLGDHDRQRVYAQLLPSVSAGALRLSAGMRGEAFTDDRPAWLPLAGAELTLCPHTIVYATYAETVRQPSFTELNYDSPGSLGDAGLDRQEHQALEAGVRQKFGEGLHGHAAVFNHWSRNSVDWVRRDAEATRFEAVNLGPVDSLGAEIGARGRITDRFALSALYTWMDKDHDADIHASRYVLDYARHLVQLTAIWRVTDALRLTGTQWLRWQRTNPLRESDDFGAVGALAAQLALPGLPGAMLTLSLDNVWDDDFQTFAGQPVAGRRASAGLTLDW